MVKAAYEERFVVSVKQISRLDMWPVNRFGKCEDKDEDEDEDKDVTTEEEEEYPGYCSDWD